MTFCLCHVSNYAHVYLIFLIINYMWVCSTVQAHAPLSLTHTHTHTHAHTHRQHWLMMPFTGSDRQNTWMILEQKMSAFLFYHMELGVTIQVCLHVSLHNILYVISYHVGILRASLVCLHGVWCLYSNDQQVFSIVSACNVLCWWEKVSQPYTASNICANRLVGTLVNTFSITFFTFFLVCDWKHMIKADARFANFLTFYPSV